MNWGNKVTIHVYLEGELDPEAPLDAANAMNAWFPEAHFVGVSLEEIEAEPKDQVGT